eukprot:148898_1
MMLHNQNKQITMFIIFQTEIQYISRQGTRRDLNHGRQPVASRTPISYSIQTRMKKMGLIYSDESTCKTETISGQWRWNKYESEGVITSHVESDTKGTAKCVQGCVHFNVVFVVEISSPTYQYQYNKRANHLVNVLMID